MVGTGEFEEKLRLQVVASGLDRYVSFTSRVNQVADHLNVADVCISTSLSDGASVFLQEAMACGLPVVVTEVEGNLERVKDRDDIHHLLGGVVQLRHL